MKAGIRLLGFGSAAAGVLDLIYGEFEAAHQPIQALSDRLAATHWLADLAGLWLIAAGLAIQCQRTRRAGAIALAVIYACFAAFWIPRLWIVPRMLGHSWRLYVGLVTGPCVQIVPVTAALMLVGLRVQVARYVTAFCTIMFGVEHLANPADVATLIPAWMPLGGKLWAIVSGICFVLAGVAFALAWRDVLAARLLAVMYLVFSALSLIPLVIASPRDHTSWGGNFVNLAIVGATLVFAELLTSSTPRPRRARSTA